MAHFFLLRGEVALVVGVGGYDDRHALDDLQPIALKSRDLAGVVGEKSKTAYSEVD